jgi:hypothetical protein
MAYIRDQQKKMSYSFATFFSSEKKDNEFQFIKLGFYDGKLTFNFLKGTSGGGSEGGDSYTSMEYETACLLKNYVDSLIRSRVDKYRSGQPYDDTYVTYNFTFVDKTTREVRNAGSLSIRTVARPENGSGINTIHIQYNSGTNNYDIALGNPYMHQSYVATEEQFTDVDKGDSRLYAFAYLLNNIINNWPTLAQSDRIASVVISRIQALQEQYFSALFNKMGIPLPSGNNNSDGKYSEKYRSSQEEQSDTPF